MRQCLVGKTKRGLKFAVGMDQNTCEGAPTKQKKGSFIIPASRSLNTAFQHTQLEHHHTPDVGEMGRFAMHTTVARFRELPGVTYKKRNVRTPARSFQEHQIRNYASFIANFQAFANSEHSDLRLFPHQFAFMDMVTRTVDNEDISIVFQEKLSLSEFNATSVF